MKNDALLIRLCAEYLMLLGCLEEMGTGDDARFTELLAEIVQLPARTEAGFRARLYIWRLIDDAEDAELLLQAITADFGRRRA